MDDRSEQEKYLFTAIFCNTTDLVQELLEAGVRVNATDSQGLTPLHEAASVAHPACLDILLRYDVDLDGKSYTGQTALHRAAGSNSKSMNSDIMACVQLLVDGGASLSVRDGSGLTPFEVANQANNRDVAIFLKAVADDRKKKEEEGRRGELLQEMVEACEIGDQCELEKLVSQHPDLVNCSLDDGSTLLHRCCKCNDNVEIVRLLISRGATLYFDQHKKTPLDYAAEMGATSLVAEMMHCRSKSVDGNFALLVAAEKGYCEVVETLIISQVVAYKELVDQVKHGLEADEDPTDLFTAIRVNINCEDMDGRTALHRASQGNFIDVVKALLTCAPRNICLRHGINLGIDKAAMFTTSHSSIGKPVVSSGSYDSAADSAALAPIENDILVPFKKNIVLDLEVRSQRGYTAFHEACHRRNFDIIRLLAHSDVDVNAMEHPRQLGNPTDYNALVDAVIKDQCDLVDQLLKLGVKDTLNHTAFNTAVQFGKDNMVAVMLAHTGVVEVTDDNIKPMRKRSQYTQLENCKSKFSAQWNGLALYIKGDWDLKFAWLSLTPQYLSVGGMTAVISKLYLRENQLTKVPPELFQMECLEVLDLSKNTLICLPFDNVADEHNNKCDKLKDIDVSDNMLTTLPVDLFRLKSLVQVNAMNNAIESLPVDMWLSRTIEQMNFANNCLKDLPRSEPCLVQEVRSMTTRDSGMRKRSLTQRKKPRLHTVRPQHVSYSLTPYTAQLRSTVSLPDGAIDNDEDEDEDVVDVGASLTGNLVMQRTFRSSLRVLNVSHNKLVSIPVGLPCLAQNLERLNLSHNRITSLGCPSDYPKGLTTLDASGNGANRAIRVEHEDTDGSRLNSTTICYGVVQGSFLGGLSLSSHSVIQCQHRSHESLPKLECLKLSENYLTKVYIFSGFQGYRNVSEHEWVDIEVSGQVSAINEEMLSKPLFPHLAMLDVRYNRLDAVPYRVWDLSKLGELLLSHNKGIKELPTAMGRLVNLFRLDLEGVSDELSIPSHVNRKRATEVIRHLRSIHEQASEYRRIKLMLVGCHRQGKTTLLRLLKQGSKATISNHFNQRREGVLTCDSRDWKYDQISTVGVDLGKWTYTKSGSFFRRNPARPAIEFLTWDFAGQDEYYATHQCFLSKRALYLVVWNVENDVAGIEEMEKWLMNIQARAPNAVVILVGTHIDKVTDIFLQRIRDDVIDRYHVGNHSSVQKDKGLPRIIAVMFVSCVNGGKGIDHLRQLIYTTASELSEVVGSYVVKLMEQLVPSSYIQLENQIVELAKRARDSGNIPVLQDTEFREKASVIISDPDDLKQAVNFLHQNGVLLHYNDPQLRRLYFIDPQWLCDMLAHIVTVDHVTRCIKNGIMKQDQLEHVFKGKVFDKKNEYVHLLIKFEVALPVGPEQEYLLIPSKLPDSIHEAQSLQPQRYRASHDAKSEVFTVMKSVVCRFYYMMYVPSGFWPRLISRLLSSRQFGQIVSSIVVSSTDEEGVAGSTSSSFSPTWFYWKTGIELRVNDCCILSVKEVSASQEGIIGTMVRVMDGSLMICIYGKLDVLQTSGYKCIEIVAANLSRRDSSSDLNESNDIPSLKTAELLANAVEAIDLLLDDWYPAIANDGGTGQGNPFLTKIAPCPVCLERLVAAEREAFGTQTRHENEQDGQVVSVASQDSKSCYCPVLVVFQLMECAQKAQSERTIGCPHDGDIDLSRMTPELLFHDLKLNFIVEPKQLVEEEVVGVGAFADVCKGRYYPKTTEGDLLSDAGVAVAIKKLQQRQRDSHCMEAHDANRELSVDKQETEAYKAYRAYLETRREVGIFANINHEHIVQFFGVQLDPRSLILEWAPMGSLEAVLKTYGDSSIAPRPLQQLIVQVADGVSYLHSKSIVYRDLKSSNVLVWKFPEPLMQLSSSMHSDSTGTHGVWVKLADFGVSRLAAPGGLVRGESGTPGFMAPEIVLFRGDEAYTEKADIYSFAMLMYEVLCQKYPFEGYQAMEIDKFVKEKKHPELPKKVVQYPQGAVHLMQHCWSFESQNRPTAAKVVQIAESEDFVRLLDCVQLRSEMRITTCCFVSANLVSHDMPSDGTDTESEDEQNSQEQENALDQNGSVTNVWEIPTRDGKQHPSGSSMEESVTSLDLQSTNDVIWLCEQRVATSNDTLLNTAEYFRERDISFDESCDVVAHDVVCSMLIIDAYVVVATCNSPRILVYEIANRSKHKQIFLPQTMTDGCGLRQMICGGDRVFLALQCGNVISLSSKNVVSSTCDAMSESQVCSLFADDLFCLVAVAKGDKSAQHLEAADLELWCGLPNGCITIVDVGNMTQLGEISVQLDAMSISAFVINTVAFLAITRSTDGQQIVWASVQPGTFVYGFRSTTREPVTTINCLPHLISLPPIVDSPRLVRQLSGTQGTITALKANESQLYIGTSSGHILVINEARNVRVLHAHHSGISFLLPFEVESDDPQWLPRFWRSQPMEMPQNQTNSLSESFPKRKLLISFGQGCKHDVVEQDDSAPSTTRERRNDEYMMIWLVDDSC